MYFLSPISFLLLLSSCSTKPSKSIRFPHIDQKPLPLDGQNHKTCSVGGEKGLCVFQWACSRSGGKSLGVCRSGYQFGSCCAHPSDGNEIFFPSSSTEPTVEQENSEEQTIPEVYPPPSTWKNLNIIESHTNVPCGVQLKDRRPFGRIVNGSKTHHGEFPWQASIRTFQDIQTGFDHQCGGVLINEQWIATAAHCVSRKLSLEIRVRLGEHDFSVENPSQAHKDYTISKKVLHPDYNEDVSLSARAFESDLALLKLRTPAKILKHVSPICLVEGEDTMDGQYGIVTGWGRTKQDGPISTILQKVSLPIISNRECEGMYTRAGFSQEIPDIFFCAGLENGGIDSCNGDSGGPMQTQFSDGRFGLVGIVSWGNGCGEPFKPGVYTRMTKFLPWILETIKADDE